MEELKRLSIEYYKNTVGLRFFGLKGMLYLLLSIPFIAASLYLVMVLQFNNLGMLPLVAAAIFWNHARKEYDRKLVRHLCYYTHLDTDKVSNHKALYLHELTFHVSATLHGSMKKFQELIEVDKKSKMLIIDNGWAHFRKFLYDPESKSRIISLLIYLISLFAITIIIKGNHEINVYQLIDAISISGIQQYLLLSLMAILIGYIVVVIPLMFFIIFIVYPVLLKMSVNGALINHFITELSRYSFHEQSILANK